MRAIVLVLMVAGCAKKSVLIFADENNYAYSNSITIQSGEVQAGADLTVDWSGVTTDVRGRPVDATQIEQMSLVKFAYSYADLIPLIEQNKIDAQSQADEIYLFDNCVGSSDPCTTTVATSGFEITGVAFDPATLLVEDPTTTWLVSALNKPRGSIDLLMSRAIIPTAASAETTVNLADGDTAIDATVDLHSQPAITAAESSLGYSLDWSAVTKDVFGNPYDSVLADELLIGHYSGMSLADVEANFLQLDSVPDVATDVYRASVVQSTSLDDLSAAVDEAGDPFPGFDTDGTWLIGVVCTSCSTPVPLLLGAVEFGK